MNVDRTRQPGFTLLEVVLAVALTAIIATLIASAIDFHLRQLTVRRMQIEEAQLARAVLRRIADDLRGAVVYRPADFSTIEELSETFEDAEAIISGEQDLDEADAETEEAVDQSSGDYSTSNVSSSTPGLFGNENQLQVDVSRIPRPEEFNLMMQFGDPSQLGSLSDVKTVSYFMVSDPSQFAGTGPSQQDFGLGTNQIAVATGLARRVIDRATSRFATDNGIFSLLDQEVDVFAPEVTSIQFAYYDGLEWSMEWDSDLRGGVPVAVEITLIILPEDQRQFSSQMEMQTAMSQISSDSIYRLVVYLPSSDPEELAAFAAGETGDTETTTDMEGL